MHFTHPRCWQWRFPAQGQCFLGPSSWMSQDKRSIKWLGVPKQRSRSMGLAEQTGKRRAEHKKTNPTQLHFLKEWNRFITQHIRHCALYCTFMEGTAEVGAAVSLVLASAASLSFRFIWTALAPYTQLFTAALLILNTRLKEEEKKCFSISQPFNKTSFITFQQTSPINCEFFLQSWCLKSHDERHYWFSKPGACC